MAITSPFFCLPLSFLPDLAPRTFVRDSLTQYPYLCCDSSPLASTGCPLSLSCP